MRMQKWGKCARQNGALFSEYRWNGVMTLLTFLPATPPLGPEPLFPYPSPLVFLNSSIFPTNIGGQFHQLLIFDSRIPPPNPFPHSSLWFNRLSGSPSHHSVHFSTSCASQISFTGFLHVRNISTIKKRCGNEASITSRNSFSAPGRGLIYIGVGGVFALVI